MEVNSVGVRNTETLDHFFFISFEAIDVYATLSLHFILILLIAGFI